jgi:hypothetical protein
VAGVANRALPGLRSQLLLRKGSTASVHFLVWKTQTRAVLLQRLDVSPASLFNQIRDPSANGNLDLALSPTQTPFLHPPTPDSQVTSTNYRLSQDRALCPSAALGH